MKWLATTMSAHHHELLYLLAIPAVVPATLAGPPVLARRPSLVADFKH